MEIIRNSETLQIRLNPYKIHIKEIKNKHSKSYQYTCILPPLLCSYFNIPEEEGNKENYPNLYFYDYLDNFYNTYITSSEELTEAAAINSNKYAIEETIRTLEDNNLEIPEDIKKQYNSLPEINYNLYDNIKEGVFTTAYKLSKSNSYRVTLPSKLFKNEIKNNKDNYIIFTIDTNKKGLLNKGVVKVHIIHK